MYSLISVDIEEVSKAKGVNKKMKRKEYVGVLFNRKVVRHNMGLVNYMGLVLMMFTRFHCLVLMIKDMY